MRLIRPLRSTYDWIRRPEMFLFVPVFFLVVGTWLFIATAEEVLEGDTHAFDARIVQAMRRPEDLSVPIGPPWLHEAGRDITALGGTFVLILVSVVVAGYLHLQKKYHAMILVLLATNGGFLITWFLKDFFMRERPTEVPHLSETVNSSFPSGHSMLSACVYLTLGMMLARVVPGRATKVYFVLVAIVLTFLVGVSRVYLGVHYPTDVMAGWTAGLVWSLFCWVVMRYLQHRGSVEPEITPEEQR